MSSKQEPTEELGFLLLNKPNITKQTEANYKNIYFKIYNQLDTYIKDTTQDKLLDVIKEISNDKPTNEWTYINIPIMIKQLYNYKYDKLDNRRQQLRDAREAYTKEENNKKSEILPSLKVLKDFTEAKYKSGDYISFIINNLLITFGLRNKDLDLFITNKEELKKRNESVNDTNNIKNYIIIKKTEIDIIINEYKTIQTYGQKRFTLKSNKMIKALNELPINSYLLSANGSRISDLGLNKYIQNRTYNGLSEGDYFKILIKDAMTKSNSLELLKYYSRTRGTSAETIIQNYNIQGMEKKV